jgi:hypothetical protein
MRISVDLPAKQIKTLDTYAKSKGISRAAAVREALVAYLPLAARKKKKTDWRKHPSFGSWKGPKIDSVEYVRKLRAEWDHRARLYNY